MNRVAKPQRHRNHSARQYSKAPIQRWILLGILINRILTNRLLSDANQTHEPSRKRLVMDADESLPVRSGTPHRHESFLLFIQKPDRPLVRMDGLKRIPEDFRNAFRAPKAVQLKKGYDNGLCQFNVTPPLLSFLIQDDAPLSMPKTSSLRQPSQVFQSIRTTGKSPTPLISL